MEPTALITGASRGIGRSCAEELSRKGYRVAIHYNTGKEQATNLSQSLSNSIALKADITNEDECKMLIENARKELGRIDVIVNNAGVNIDQMITFAKPNDFDRIVQTNLRSTFLLSKFASKIMIKQKYGRIINISSIIGHTGNSGQSMYAATKGAITAFTKSIAKDLASFQITANCVAPGFIGTDMTNRLTEDTQKTIIKTIPLGRIGSPQDIANGVAFLASEKASYITGITLHINGGMYSN